MIVIRFDSVINESSQYDKIWHRLNFLNILSQVFINHLCYLYTCYIRQYVDNDLWFNLILHLSTLKWEKRNNNNNAKSDIEMTLMFSISNILFKFINQIKNTFFVFFFLSEIAALNHKFSSVTLYRNKTVKYSARMHAIIACQMEFQLYPMDIQICPIYIESCKFNGRIIALFIYTFRNLLITF